MDTLLETCISEIALEGLQGCNMKTLCARLQKTKNFAQVDQYIKQAVWKILQRACEIQLYDDSQGQQPQNPITKVGFLTKEPRIEIKEEIPLTEENEEKIKFVAKDDVRASILGLSGVDVEISDIQYCVLELVGQRREQGVLQCDISRILSIDPRNTLYHLKRLVTTNLITREQIYDDQNKILTNIIHLRRFKADNAPQKNEQFYAYKNVKDNCVQIVCDMLQKARDNVLIDLEVKQKLGFTNSKIDKNRWDRVRGLLIKSGKVEFIQAKVGDKQRRCIRLINNEQTQEEDVEKEVEVVGLVAEEPILHQLFKKISSCGKEGIRHPTLHEYFDMSTKLSAALCKVLQKEYGVISIAEKINKTASYRLIAPKEAQEQHTQIQKQLQGITEGDMSYLSPKAKPKPSKKKEKQKEIDDDSLVDPEEMQLAKPGKRIKKLITKEFADRCKSTIELLHEKKVITSIDIRRKLNITDRKTITRITEYLENQGLLKKLNLTIPMVSGHNKQHVCYTEPELSMDSSEIKEYIKSVKDSEIYVRKKTAPTVKVEEGLNVEHLELPSQATTKSAPLVTRNSVLYTSIRNGYITAKMLRVKEFHLFLWRYAIQTTNNGQKPIELKFHISDIYGKMTIADYLKIFGLAEEVPGINNYLTTTIESAPAEIKTSIFFDQKKKKIPIQKIQTFLDILEKLGLIKPDLLPPGKLEGFREYGVFTLIPNPKIVCNELNQEFEFKKLQDVEDYWMHLEQLSEKLTRKESFGDEYDSDENEQKSDSSDLLKTIPELKSFNWTEIRHYTVHQLRVLEATYKVNTEPTLQQCIDISKSLRIPIERVILYFFRYHDTIIKQKIEPPSDMKPLFDHKNVLKIRRTRSKSESKTGKKRKRDDGDSLLIENEAPVVPDHGRLEDLAPRDKLQLPKHAEAFKKQMNEKKKRKTEPSKTEQKDDEDTETDIIEQTRQRLKWTSSEDMQLLEFVAKNRELDSSGCFIKRPIPWKDLAPQINKTAEQCQRRWGHLQKISWCKSAVQLACAHKQLNPGKDIDIRGIIQSAKDDATRQEEAGFLLPENMDEFNKYFEVKFKDQYDFQFLKSDLGVRETVLQDFFKVLFLTPEESYYTEPVFKFSKRFSRSEQEACVFGLRNRGIISKNKHRQFRIRGYQLSSKFEQTLNPHYFPPDIFDDIPNYAKRLEGESDDEDADDDQLRQPERIVYPDGTEDLLFAPMCTGGEVATNLSLMSCDRLRIEPQLAMLPDKEQDRPRDSDREEQPVDSDEEKKKKGKKKAKRKKKTKSSGVKSHLIQSGAVEVGEDFVSGHEKNTGHNLRLPDWDMILYPTLEPKLHTNLGIVIKKEKKDDRKARVKYSYAQKDQIEFNIEKEPVTEETSQQSSSSNVSLQQSQSSQIQDDHSKKQAESTTAKKRKRDESNTSEEHAQKKQRPNQDENLETSNQQPEPESVEQTSTEDPKRMEILKSLTAQYKELHTLFYTILFKASNLNFEEAVNLLQMLKDIYSEVEKTKESGILESDLNEKFKDVEELPDLLNYLLNFEVIMRTFTYSKICYLSCVHAKKFLLTPFRTIITQTPTTVVDTKSVAPPTQPKNTGPRSLTDDVATLTSKNIKSSDTPRMKKVVKFVYDEPSATIIHPWLTIDGNMNYKFIQQTRRSIMEKVMRRPGITQRQLFNEIIGLNPSNLKHILQLMEMDGLLFSRSIIHKPPTLFSSDEEVYSTLDGIDENQEGFVDKCYFATKDAMLKMCGVTM